jgi:hypothetical protein
MRVSAALAPWSAAWRSGAGSLASLETTGFSENGEIENGEWHDEMVG